MGLIIFSKKIDDSGRGVTVWGQLVSSDGVSWSTCAWGAFVISSVPNRGRASRNSLATLCCSSGSGLLIASWLTDTFWVPQGRQVDLGALKQKPSVRACSRACTDPSQNPDLRTKGGARGGAKDQQPHSVQSPTVHKPHQPLVSPNLRKKEWNDSWHPSKCGQPTASYCPNGFRGGNR